MRCSIRATTTTVASADELRRIGHAQVNLVASLTATEQHYAALVEALVPQGKLALIDDPACRFSTLIDITAIDHPNRAARFDVVWQLLSMYTNQRIRIKAAVREDDLVPSITRIYPAADWFERETYDLYGVIFTGHPDMRRLLTDYGFDGHPLRKDFPLTGYTEVRWDEEKKRVVYEPVQLMQAHRNFEAASSWEQVGQGVSYTPNEHKLVPPKPAEDNKDKK